MSRGPSQRIADVLDAIERCQRYVTALGDEADADLVGMEEDAIERNLQIIGEAVNHLPAEIIDAHPGIAWPQIKGFRNILVHQDFGVDVEIVLDVVEAPLPPLAEALRANVADVMTHNT